MGHNDDRADHEQAHGPSTTAVLLGLIATLGLVILGIYVIKSLVPDIGATGWLIAAGIGAVYVLLAAIVTVNVDHGDLGWFGGLMDNPFSFSDDINRAKLSLQVLLLPGRLMAWSIVSGLRLLR